MGLCCVINWHSELAQFICQFPDRLDEQDVLNEKNVMSHASQQKMSAGEDWFLEAACRFKRPQESLPHRFSPGRLDNAYQMMAARPDGFIKGWIKL